MTASQRGLVTRAMRDLRAAVARIQTEGLDSAQILRKRAEALIARLGTVPVAMLVADNRGRYVDVNARRCSSPATAGRNCCADRCGISRRPWSRPADAHYGGHSSRASGCQGVPVTAKERTSRVGAVCRRRQCPSRPARVRVGHACVGHALPPSAFASRRMTGTGLF